MILLLFILKKNRFGIYNNFLYHYIEVRKETLCVLSYWSRGRHHQRNIKASP